MGDKDFATHILKLKLRVFSPLRPCVECLPLRFEPFHTSTRDEESESREGEVRREEKRGAEEEQKKKKAIVSECVVPARDGLENLLEVYLVIVTNLHIHRR